MRTVTIRASVANHFIEWGQQNNHQEQWCGFGHSDGRSCITIEWSIGTQLVELIIYDDVLDLLVTPIGPHRHNKLTSETNYEYCDPAFPTNVEQAIESLKT